jgi:hypothetical protein
VMTPDTPNLSRFPNPKHWPRPRPRPQRVQPDRIGARKRQGSSTSSRYYSTCGRRASLAMGWHLRLGVRFSGVLARTISLGESLHRVDGRRTIGKSGSLDREGGCGNGTRTPRPLDRGIGDTNCRPVIVVVAVRDGRTSPSECVPPVGKYLHGTGGLSTFESAGGGFEHV